MKHWTIRYIGLLPFMLAYVVQTGCSNSSSPTGNNSNNSNNNGNNVPDVAGPSVGSEYVFEITYVDTSGKTEIKPITDTVMVMVIADTLTLYGRTNVTKMKDKFGSSYFAFDANGDFYQYDTTVLYQGWHRYSTGSRVSLTENYYQTNVFLGDTLWGAAATAKYLGTGTVQVGSQSISTENVYEDYQHSLENTEDRVDLQYAPSIHCFAKMIDTTFWYSGTPIPPEITTRTLLSYSLK